MNRPASIAIAAAIAVAVLLPMFAGYLQLRLACEILYLGLFAVAFNLLFGYSGTLSFGFSSTFGVGSYVVAITLLRWPDMNILLSILLAVIAGALVGAVIGIVCVRLRGSYLALLTLAFNQLLFMIALKWRGLTGGDDGLQVRVPELNIPLVGAVDLNSMTSVYYFILVVVGFFLLVAFHVTRTPFGNSMRLLKENMDRAGFIGINTAILRILVLSFASALAAVSGALYAILQQVVTPATVDLAMSVQVVFMAILGGTGSFIGPFFGAAFYTLLQNELAELTTYWQFYLGLIFVLFVLLAPTGLTGLLTRLLSAWSKSRARA